MKTWLATDESPCMGSTLLFFGPKPRLRGGFWFQTKNPNGRWPVPNNKRQKPGEICEVVIVQEAPKATPK